MTTKKVLLIISVCTLIAFFTVLTHDILNGSQEQQQNQTPQNPPGQPQNQSGAPPNQQVPAPPPPQSSVIRVPLSGVLLIVTLSIFSLYGTYSFSEKHFEKKLQLISNVVRDEKVTSDDDTDPLNLSSAILNLLNPNERKIVNKLVDENGATLQSEISKMPSMGKVKAHRSIRDLIRKGIVVTEQYGNTNRILLTDDIKKIFLR